MTKTSSIFLAVSFFSTAWSITPNFYWRDYDGTIPSDAIPGGNLHGSQTYIGLISVMSRPDDSSQLDTPAMISAVIIPGNLTGYAGYGPRVVGNDKGVKILCTTEPDRFVWTKQLGANCVPVRGTYIKHSTTSYIGRISYQGNVATGRVSLDSKNIHFPWFDSSPFKIVSISGFEILAYC